MATSKDSISMWPADTGRRTEMWVLSIEWYSWTLRRHGIATVVMSHKTLRQLPVHLHDKRPVQDSAGVVYSNPCKESMIYISKTGRRFGMRQKYNSSTAH